MASITDITEQQFEAEVLDSELPVLVDFWAPWCGPCRVVGPEIEKIAARHDGALKVVKVNVDENPRVSAAIGIRGIPAIALFRDGALTGMSVGAQPATEIERSLGLATD